jgi:hypothetical protein
MFGRKKIQPVVEHEDELTDYLKGSQHEQILRPQMISPADFVRLKGRSLLSDRVWYLAIWETQTKPMISTNKFSQSIGASYMTAKQMREKIREALNAEAQDI